MGPKTAAMVAFGFWLVTLWFRLAEVGMGLFPMNLVLMSAIATLVGMGPSAWHTNPALLASRIAALPPRTAVTAAATLGIYHPKPG